MSIMMRIVKFLVAVTALYAGASEGASIKHRKLERQRRGSLRGRDVRRHKWNDEASSQNEESLLLRKNDLPLYDDFLDLMNHAADNALQANRLTNAYDDFIEYMKRSPKMEQGDMPSKADFKKSLIHAAQSDKEHIPSYDEFLVGLAAGAEQAMRHRKLRAKDADHLQTTGNHTGRASQNPFDAIAKGVEDVAKAADEAQMEAENAVNGESRDEQHKEFHDELQRMREIKKRRGPIPQRKKPLMNKINVLRTELCWKRPNLMKHEKCMRFLGISCFEESTGLGICDQFHEDVAKLCKSETDPEWKSDYCALAEALSDKYGDDDEGSEADESTKSSEGKEKKDKGTGDEVIDKDLDEALEKKDKELGDGSGNQQKSNTGDTSDDNGGAVDSDGDGVTDDKDLFPDDAKEWADTDKDGIGDNSDKDIDGDGHDNADDAFPNDPKEWNDLDKDGIGDNADTDRDGDSYDNDKDAFPDDPSEWKDTDKDGVGDNKDAHPNNPNCHDPDEPCEDESEEAPPPPKAGSVIDPADLDMSAERKLPEQGYNEHSVGDKVSHSNYYTWVGDWQDEWPVDQATTEIEEIKRICRTSPRSAWCKKYIAAARRGDAGSWR